MLWNWYTIDACFLSTSWHVQSAGAFAGSCLGVIFLVIALEFLRRVQRETDRAFHRRDGQRAGPVAQRARSSAASSASDVGASKTPAVATTGAADCEGANCAGAGAPRGGEAVRRLQLWQQVVRSLLYMLQFAVGYFVMLLAMYYNGRLPRSEGRVRRPLANAIGRLYHHLHLHRRFLGGNDLSVGYVQPAVVSPRRARCPRVFSD